jgi:uncharacterized protein (TIGR03435 family)
MPRVLGRIALTLALAVGAVFGQTPTAPPAFEVASIKPAPGLNPADAAAGKLHVGMTIDGARVDIGFLSLADLIPIAYRLKRYQVSGPDWMAAQRFDVQATLPEGASKDQVPEMLQALLAERFKLVAHRDSKENSVYALVVGKNGPKLKDSPPDTATPSDDKSSAGAAIGDAKGQMRVNVEGKSAVVVGGQMGKMRMSMGPDGMMHMEAEKMTMPSFADLLSPFLDRPVVDLTELKGSYQISLSLSMDDLRGAARKAGMAIPGQAGPGSDAGRQPAAAASDPSGGSLFSAVQQLGLKLESRKVPVEILVIDHLEKNPTEN